MAKEGDYALLRLPSGEIRKVHINCRATIGQVGNIDAENICIGKAGRSRWLGIRPANRGVVMNPNDHPHGGGEGKTSIGRPGPCTPWGKPALGLKTHVTFSTSLTDIDQVVVAVANYTDSSAAADRNHSHLSGWFTGWTEGYERCRG